MINNIAEWWIIACRCDTCLPTKAKSFNYLIYVKTWLFKSRKEFYRKNTFWTVIYFTLQQEEEHTNSDLMMLSAAGSLTWRGNEGLVDELKRVSRCMYSCRVSAVVERRGSRHNKVGLEHTWTVRSVFWGEWYWDKGSWAVACKFTLIIETKQHQEVLMCAFGKIVWKCFILFRSRHRLRAGKDLKILSPKSYKTDDGWLC